MSYNLKIITNQSEGSFLRMVGLINRRGFSIISLNLSQNDEKQEIVTCVAPRDDTRSIDVLIRQVERLIDVQTVEHVI